MNLENIIYLILLSFPFGVFFFAKHIRYYNAVVDTLTSRGLASTGMKASMINYGFGGCTGKIKTVKSQFAVELTEQEQKLLDESRKAYWHHVYVFMPLIIVLVVSLLNLLQ